MLAAHEASYRQSLRSLKKKISALHNRTTAASQAAGENLTCHPGFRDLQKPRR